MILGECLAVLCDWVGCLEVISGIYYRCIVRHEVRILQFSL